jgi:hypothetical protein
MGSHVGALKKYWYSDDTNAHSKYGLSILIHLCSQEAKIRSQLQEAEVATELKLLVLVVEKMMMMDPNTTYLYQLARSPLTEMVHL